MPEAARAETPPAYSVAMGYLRGVGVLMVVIWHALLAYYPGPFPPYTEHVHRMAMPVQDAHRYAFPKIYVALQDNYLMSLMFFISGLFLWSSLRRKGAGAFVRDRVLRLGLPFLVAAGLGGALAYYPAYLQAHPAGTIADYFATWQQPGQWMSGAAWFVAVLLLFDTLAAAMFVVWPRWGDRLARLSAGAETRPLRYFALVAALSTLAYAPLALALGPFSWWNIGPFWLQESRALQYPLYFLLGVSVGAHGLGRGLAAANGALARRWWAWGLAAIAAFLIVANAIRVSINDGFTQSLPLGLLVDLGWVVGCALSSFAMIALFRRFARPNPILGSLASNSYGMYLTHYPMVIWIQYALLAAPIAPWIKGLIVIAGAVCGSWLLTAALRRIPLLGRIV